jgi:5-methylthioadenosine/S-adenosylhomocysteine deaminase
MNPIGAQPPALPADRLITGGCVLTMDAAHQSYYPGSVAVVGGRIAAVGLSKVIDPAYSAAETLDSRGHVVLPGLVNIHGHASNSLIRGLGQDLDLHEWLRRVCWPIMDRADEDDLYNAVRLSALEMLLNGVTTFADMWTGVGASAQAVAETGQRAMLAHNIKDFGDTARHERELAVALDAHVRWHNLREGRIRVGLGPHSVYTCRRELLAECASEARRLGLHIQIHGSETVREVAECQARHGCSPVELMAEVGILGPLTVVAHAVHLSDHDLQELGSASSHVAHNVASNLKLASGMAPVARYLAQGLNVGLGTDGPGSNDGLDLLRDLKLAALVQKGLASDATTLPAEAALEMVTRNGARALGWDDEIGSLEPGKQADLILVDFDRPHLTPHHFDNLPSIHSNLVYCASGADVDTVMVGGQLLVRGGQPVQLEAAAIREAAQRSAERLIRDVGVATTRQAPKDSGIARRFPQ